MRGVKPAKAGVEDLKVRSQVRRVSLARPVVRVSGAARASTSSQLPAGADELLQVRRGS